MTLLSDLAESLPSERCRGYCSLGEKEIRAIRMAAKKWPDGTLGKSAVRYLHTTKNRGTYPLIDGDDMYWISEAIRGRHYRHEIVLVDR